MNAFEEGRPSRPRDSDGCRRDGHCDGSGDRRSTTYRTIDLAGGADLADHRHLTVDVIRTSRPGPDGSGVTGQSNEIVFVVRGEFDTVAVDEMRRIHDRGWRWITRFDRVVADLAGVVLIDCAAVRLLEEVAAVVAGSGGRFVVRRPSSIVTRVLGALGIAASFANDDDDARCVVSPPPASFAAPGGRDHHAQRHDAQRHDGRMRDVHVVHVPDPFLARNGHNDRADSDGQRPVSSYTRGRPVRWITVTDSPIGSVRIPSTPSALDRFDGRWPDDGARRPVEEGWDPRRSFDEGVASTLDASCRLGDSVWLRDDPLMAVPSVLRMRRPDLTIGFSLQSSFDDAAISAFDPHGRIARSLSECDLIGVQSLADADRLTAFLTGAGPVEMPTVAVTPTSIDPDEVRACAAAADGSPTLDDLEHRLGSRLLIAAADDLDHSSAVCERLDAYDSAFRRGVLDPEEVHIVQIVDSRRVESRDHRALRVEIERLAHSVNATWQSADRAPVLEVHFDTLDRPEALAVLRRADICIVTSERAGATCTAKEFSVLTGATAGILILSSRIAVAAELGPYSILVHGSGAAPLVGALETARTLDTDGRRRHAARRAQVLERWTTADWENTFLHLLDGVGTRVPAR